MAPRKTAFTSIDPQRVLLAVLLGAGFAWLVKEPFTSLLLAGKTFEGRALPVQVILYSALLLIFATIFLFPLGRLTGFLIRKANAAAAVLALIPLAAHAWMGSYSRFVSDDFSSAALAVRLGVWGAAVDWYLHWTGRFSANLVDSLTGYLGQKALSWQVFIVLLLWTTALTLLLRRLIPGSRRGEKWLAALFLSAMMLTTVFQAAPDLPQSLYWAQGMHSLILPLALGTFLAVILHHSCGRETGPGGTWIASAALLAFFAGGFGETYVSLQTLLLAITLTYALTAAPSGIRSRLVPIAAASLGVSVLAMAVIILSPGNAARQALFPPTPSVPALVWISLQAFLTYLAQIFPSALKTWQWLALFLASMLVGAGFLFRRDLDTGAEKMAIGPRLAWIVLFTVALVFSCFVPSAFGMSTSPPGRTLVIPTFILAAGITAAGFTIGAALRPGVRKALLPENTAPRVAAAWVLFLVFAAHLLITTRGIISFLPEYSRFARVSDQVEEVIRQAKDQGLTEVEIPEVHNHFGLSDFGVGTTDWLDDAVDEYYGIHVIINKNLNHSYP